MNCLAIHVKNIELPQTDNKNLAANVAEELQNAEILRCFLLCLLSALNRNVIV